jgi:hypothetical protein
MSDSYQVATILKFADGSEFRLRMQSYSEKSDAEKARAETNAGIGGLIQDAVVTIKGPEGQIESPMTLKQFIAALGIVGIGHTLYQVPVHGSVILAAQPSIVLLQ